MLRLAEPGDAGALLAIYAQYIDTPVTFEYDLPGEEEFRRRIETVAGSYPYLVFQGGGTVMGFAYAHRHMERAAYQWNAELSVYLEKSARGLGLGRTLYAALIDLLRLQGVRNVFGCVTLPNPRSERLHEAMGFRRAGTYTAAGYKNDRWRDICWYQKTIMAYDAPPAPFRPLGDVEPAEIAAVLDAHNVR